MIHAPLRTNAIKQWSQSFQLCYVGAYVGEPEAAATWYSGQGRV